ncbi:NAD(P)/FAD-dependent oxidoreductase [Devosia ginsengisoli]|uniref:NAD(P)/FAD-dependent oxidoreductase n=1 Tax=Devosia ginsengisoli TaxID=400770 RepID=UPI0026EBAB59|nr:FAD-dependent oxidoreductase [Devosia ginsengisoli]MCR6670702.1 FAD-dependent oxidoreductase [Devosia ginsengisoli]
MRADPIVIIGGGESATCAIAGLRSEGYRGPVVWVCEEDIHAYERPTLSKQFLGSSHARPSSVIPPELLDDPAIDIRLDTRATHLDAANRLVTLGTSERIAYSGLLLATGAEARDLDLPGRNSDRWLTLRRAGDAARLRPYLNGQSRIVIVGAGLIGLELAAAARMAGAQVTVIESQDRPLARVLPPAIAEIALARHRAMGVAFRFGTTIASVESGPTGERLLLSSGAEITADLVPVAIGSIPRTELAEAAGLAIANGVVVDAQLRTSQAGIWASGDCCAFPLDGRLVRLESWEAARQLGEIAGRNMAGRALPTDIVPWFWSDQYDLGIQGLGLPPDGATLVHRVIDPESALSFALCPAGRLRAVHGIGPETSIAKHIKRARPLIRDGAVCDPAILQDADQPLWAAFPPLAVAS